MSCNDKIDTFRGRLFIGFANLFGSVGSKFASPVVSLVAVVLSIALFGFGFNGLVNHYEEETTVTALYVQSGTRLENEYQFDRSRWGISGNQFVVLSDPTNPAGAANPVAMEALKENLINLVKYNESVKCDGYDGTQNGAIIEAECATLDEAIRNNTLYCLQTCHNEAGYDHIPIGFYEKFTNQYITERDLCDDVADAKDITIFAPSQYPSMPATDPEFALPMNLYSLTLGQLMQTPTSSILFVGTNTDASAIFDANKMAWAQIVLDSVLIQLGTPGNTLMDGAVNATGVLYSATYPAFLGLTGVSPMDITQVTDSATSFIVESVLTAIGAGTSSWLPASFGGQGNIASWGYQEIASCAASAMSMPTANWKDGAYINALFGGSSAEYGANSAAVAAAESTIIAALKLALPAESEAEVFAKLLALLPSSPEPSFLETHGCTPSPPAPPLVLPSSVSSAGLNGVLAYFQNGGQVPGTTIVADITAAAINAGFAPSTLQVNAGIVAALQAQAFADITGVSITDGELAAKFAVQLSNESFSAQEETALASYFNSAISTFGATGSESAAGVAFLAPMLGSAPPLMPDNTSIASNIINADPSLSSNAVYAGMAAMTLAFVSNNTTPAVNLGIAFISGADPVAASAFGLNDADYLQLVGALNSALACAGDGGCIVTATSSAPVPLQHWVGSTLTALGAFANILGGSVANPATPAGKNLKYLQPTFVALQPANLASLETFSFSFGSAVIQTLIGESNYNDIRNRFAIPTVNFKARPLPRNWGISRFPCTVISPLDAFREGDYAHPYDLKLLQEVSYGIFAYMSAYEILGLPNCVDEAMVNPGMSTVYATFLQTDYRGSEQAALHNAECLFAQTVQAVRGEATAEAAIKEATVADFTTAGGAATIGYLSEGPVIADCTEQDIIGNVVEFDLQGQQIGAFAVVLARLYAGDRTLEDPLSNASLIGSVNATITAHNTAVSPLPALELLDQQIGGGIASALLLSSSLGLNSSNPPNATAIVDLAMAWVAGANGGSIPLANQAELFVAFSTALPTAVACGSDVTCIGSATSTYIANLGSSTPTHHGYFAAVLGTILYFDGLVTLAGGSAVDPPTRIAVGTAYGAALQTALGMEDILAGGELTAAHYTNLSIAYLTGLGVPVGANGIPGSPLYSGLLTAIPNLLSCLPADEICNTCHGSLTASIVAGLPQCQVDEQCTITAMIGFVGSLSSLDADDRDLYAGHVLGVATALSHLPALQNFAVQFGTGVASAIGLKVAVSDQMGTIASSLVAFGYSLKGTYGSHRTNAILESSNPAVEPFKKQYMSTPELYNATPTTSDIPAKPTIDVLEAISHAVKYYNYDENETEPGGQRPSVVSCFLYKQFPDGTPLDGCINAWSSTIYAPDLIIADITPADPGYTENQLGPNGISRVEYIRATLSDYSNANPVSKRYIKTKLGISEELSDDEMYQDLHLPKEGAQSNYLLKRWEREVGSGFAPGEPYESLKLDFAVDRSSADVIEEATKVEWSNLAVCYVVMIIVIGLSMTSFKSNVESHFWLGVYGVIVIAFAVVAALGASVWWFEIYFTPVASNVAPFIALGIGVDDMLVVCKAFELAAKKDRPVSEQLRETLAEAGPSVTFTTLTNFFAFLVAMTTPVNVVKWFSQLMAISVIFNYIFLFGLFLPVVALDAYRCKKHNPEFCCVKSDKLSWLSVTNFMENYYGPFLMKNPVRICVLVIFSIFFGIQLWQGIAETELGIRNSDIMLSGTHQNDFYALNELYFTYYPVSIITSSTDLDDPDVQVQLMMIANNVAASPWVESPTSDSSQIWVQDVVAEWPVSQRVTINITDPPPNCNGDATFPTRQSYEALASGDFYYAFASYLGGFGSLSASAFKCLNTTSNMEASCFDAINAYPSSRDGSADIIITAVRSSFYLKNQLDSPEIIDSIENLRESVDNCYISGSPHWTYPYGYTFLYWEQYIHSWDNLIEVVGLAIIAVIATTFVMQFSVRSSLMIAALLLMTVIELLGFIPEHGKLKLNAFSIVNLAIAVGMSIEFTAHLVHQFLAVDGVDRKDRTIKALVFMGDPMFFGMLSSLISCSFLAVSDTEFIRQYYFAMFFAMIIIAALNGFVLLPVLLSLFGDSALIAEGSGMGRASAASMQTQNQYQDKNGAIDGFGFPADPEKGKRKSSAGAPDNYLQVGEYGRTSVAQF